MPADPGPYTTPEEVRMVAPAIGEDEDLTMAIKTAHSLVRRVCVPSRPEVYSTETLALIEAWLAAHFFHVQAPAAANEKAGPVGAAYQYFVQQDLRNTMFGQQAIMLDTNGGLAALMIQAAKGRSTPRVSFLGGVR